MNPMMRELSRSDLLLLTLWKAAPNATFERGPELAEALNSASQESPLYRAFRWNEDYKSSKGLNEALNLLDLTGMIVGENMPTRRFDLTGQAKGSYAQRLFEGLGQAERETIEQIAERVREVVQTAR